MGVSPLPKQGSESLERALRRFIRREERGAGRAGRVGELVDQAHRYGILDQLRPGPALLGVEETMA